MDKPIAVFAGTHEEFKEFQRNSTGKKLVFCDSWPQFAGFKFSEFVEIGSFRKREDALDIYQRVIHVGGLSSLIHNKRIVDYQCYRQEPHK